MRLLSTLVIAATVLACGKKAPPEAPADDDDEAQAITAEMPDTPEARKYARRLVDTTVSNWQAAGGATGAVVNYTALTFAPDGTWSAEAMFEADFEEIECKETGTWTIAAADSAETATMEWHLGKTSCPAREAGETTRVEMTLFRNGEVKIAYR